VNLEFDVKKIKQNEPYVAVTEAETGESQYFIVEERKVTIESITFQDALIDMISLYFVLDITALYPILLTI